MTNLFILEHPWWSTFIALSGCGIVFSTAFVVVLYRFTIIFKPEEKP